MKLKYVTLMAVAVAAGSLSACAPAAPSYDDEWRSDRDTRICRDRRGNRAPDRECRSRSGGFGWYYMNRGAYIPAVGRPITSQGYTRPRAGANYVTPTAKAPANAVTRGGFGSSVSSSSGRSSVGG